MIRWEREEGESSKAFATLERGLCSPFLTAPSVQLAQEMILLKL